MLWNGKFGRGCNHHLSVQSSRDEGCNRLVIRRLPQCLELHLCLTLHVISQHPCAPHLLAVCAVPPTPSPPILQSPPAPATPSPYLHSPRSLPLQPHTFRSAAARRCAPQRRASPRGWREAAAQCCGRTVLTTLTRPSGPALQHCWTMGPR